MSQPTAGDVHVNRPLTNISIAFLQDVDGYVADRVFPVVPSQMQSDLYYSYPRGYFLRDQMQKRAPGTESAGAGYTVTTDSFFCEVWALHKDVHDQIRANTDNPLNHDRDATMFLTEQGLIRKENLFVSNYLSATIWTTEYTGVTAAPTSVQFIRWDDYTNSDPLVDLRAGKLAMKKLTGKEPNTLVFGAEVWNALIDHPAIIDRVKYGQTAGAPAMVTQNAVAALLGIDRVLVQSAIHNTAKEGQTDSFNFIAGKMAWMGYVNPNPSVMTTSAGFTFSWTGMFGANAIGGRMKKIRAELLASDRLEIEMAFQQKLVSADLGVFFATAIS